MSLLPVILTVVGCSGALLLVSALLYMFADMTYQAFRDRDIPAALAFSGLWLVCVSAGLYQLYIWGKP